MVVLLSLQAKENSSIFVFIITITISSNVIGAFIKSILKSLVILAI